ncbi:MAG: DUF6350 family protein [Actinomycetaceae bacterium]|nr:DUF6350 family protein [Actinomycetaceae bacterium]
MRSDSDNTPTEILTPLSSATSQSAEKPSAENKEPQSNLPFEEISSEQEVAELVLSTQDADGAAATKAENDPAASGVKTPPLRIKAGAPSAAVRAAAQKRARELEENQRKVITLRITKTHWKLGFAAILTFAVSLVPAFAVTAAAFIFTASNRWVLETNWDTVNQISLEIWAAGFLSPVTLGATTFRFTPLLITFFTLLALILITRNSGAESWLQASVVPAGFAILSTLLSIAFVTYVSLVPTIIGIWALAFFAWLATVRYWPQRPKWWEKLAPFRLAPAQLRVWSLTTLGGASLALLVANYLGWQRITGIHELLNASTADTVVIIFAQLLFLPNALAATSAWYSGAGFYTAADALQTPTQAVILPIPAIPELGAIAQAPVGNWVIFLPVGLGLVAGLGLAWLHRAHSLTEILSSYLVSLPIFAALVTFIMWASTGTYGSGRLNLLGPNWLPAGLYLSLEIAGTAALAMVLLHQSTLEKLKLVSAPTETIDPEQLAAELAEEEPLLTDADVADVEELLVPVDAVSENEFAEAETEPIAIVEPETESESEPETEPLPEADANPEPESETNPETDIEPESAIEPETAPETATDSKEEDDENPT